MITEYLLKNSSIYKGLMTMDARIKQLGLTLTVMTFLFSYLFANIEVVYSNNTYGEIDLFTQKELYNGKGPNMPSDAFGLGKIVILYALVTDDGVPLQNLPVTFYVESPNGTSFSMTASTNASGIATIKFTTPHTYVNETAIIGEWFTSANVLIVTKLFQDTLTFKVNWIIKLISVRTIDENITYRTNFGIEGDVGLEISLRNIAMQMKSTMLAIVIQDELNIAISLSEIHDFNVPPNEKLVLLYCKLHIPKSAHIGKAKAFVSALTAPVDQGGVAYCPGASTNFSITPYEPLTITFHDVAVVDVVPSAASVELGQLLNVSVMARNEGTEIQNFNVTAYCGSVFIGTLEVAALLPYSKATLEFTLDTSSVDVGNYTISASTPYLVDEADFTDNTFIDGIVEIKRELPIIVHDIAIVDVHVSNNSVYIGDLLQINVSVANKGNETETFNVKTCYDSSSIETLEISALASGAQVTLISWWNTSFVPEGFYTINAYAPLPSDINALDNIYMDGVIHVKTKPPPPMIHDVAVLNVTHSSTLIYIGQTVDICVVVKNQGNYTESFNVAAFYSNNEIETKFVENLEPNSQKTLVFQWNTQNVAEGNYTLSARASKVPGEENLENNSYKDGIVTVVKAPMGWFVPYWFYWLLLLLLIPIIILLIAWYYSRKRRKRAEEAFYSGWTAWYYCCDMRKRTPKT
jgi:hypothetical protein